MWFRFCLFLLFSLFSYGFSFEIIPSSSITHAGKTVHLESPLLKKDGVLYFPAFELKKIRPTSVSYQFKDDAYLLSSGSHQVLLVNRSSEAWLNNAIHYFSSPSFYHHATFYVPLIDFFRLFDFHASLSSSSVSLSSVSTSLLSSSHYRTFPSLQTDSALLPNIIPSSYRLMYKNDRFSLSSLLKQKNGIYFIDALSLLRKIGYTISKTDQSIRLIKNGFVYTIPLQSRRWLCKAPDSSWAFYAESPLFFEGKTLFFPFRSLVSFLDYAISNNSFTASLELLDIIHSVSIDKSASFPKLSLVSRHRLIAKDFGTQDSKLSQSFIVTHATLFSSSSLSFSSGSALSSIIGKNIIYSYEQMHQAKNSFGKQNVLLHATFNRPHALYATALPNGCDFTLSTKLQSLSVEKTGFSRSLLLHGVGLSSPSVLREKSKLILDFPNTVNGLPQLSRLNIPGINSIRTSQFSESPLVTRVVIDFKSSAPKYMIKQKKDGFHISFSRPKASLSKAIAKASSKKKKTRRKKRLSSRGLRNKLIIIDPGHGGSDPGAVVPAVRYEKQYTLDIARHLKFLLEKEGALVVMTRSKDVTRSLHRRIRIANKNKGDLFLSIHLNSFTSKSARGSATYYYKYKDKKLARHLQRQLRKDLSIKSNGVKRNRFFVLRHTQMPASLVEPLFLTNPKEKSLIKTSAFRKKIAFSLFQGVKNYFNDQRG